MNAGKLNRLITIREMKTTARSTDGEPIIGWTTIATGIYAGIRPLKANEIFRLDERGYEADTMFILRYSTAIGLTETMRIIDPSSNEWDIKQIIDTDDRHREWQVIAKKVSR